MLRHSPLPQEEFIFLCHLGSVKKKLEKHYLATLSVAQSDKTPLLQFGQDTTGSKASYQTLGKEHPAIPVLILDDFLSRGF